MENIKYLLFVLTGLALSGCASFSSSPHPGKLERVGVLLVQNCGGETKCSSYSLLEADMQDRHVALTGKIGDSLKGRLIAILGTGSGEENGMELIQVEQTKAITEFDYLPFLSEAVSDYIQQKYHCASLWDQHYAWRLDGRQPVLIATLSHPFEPGSGSLKLEFDGLNKALMLAKSTPDDADPCQLR